MPRAPKIQGVAEAVLYTDDLAASRAFFADVLRLEAVFEGEGIVAFDVGTSQVLLVFERGAADADRHLYGGIIPGHRGDGPAHLAFHVSLADYAAWKEALAEAGVAIRSEVTFPAGGKSLYFDDPAGNVLELATPGHWQNF